MPELLRASLELSLEDSKRHLPFVFSCPPGVGVLTLRWSFDPPGAAELRTLITLSLHGPEGLQGGGFRGAGHRHGTLHEVTLTAGSATPGYLAGPIPAGEWTVTLHTHLVVGRTRGELVVSAPDEPAREVLPAAPVSQPPMSQPAVSHPSLPRPAAFAGGWMMGDLHCHTRHSDGHWTPRELAAAAVARGLSFLALTDHNTVSGREGLREAFPGVLLAGLELTTFHGHALALGVPSYLDWTPLEPGRGMGELAAEVGGRGGVLTLAHPFAAGDPICTGCAWTYFDLRPENATHLEVWNGPWAGRHNDLSLAYWYTLLAAGHRVVATAGTDAHGPGYLPGVGFTCTPATSDSATLLAQLREGRTYLGASACLKLTLTAPDGPVPLGGTGEAGRWTVALSWGDLPPGCTLVWVVDGRRQPEPLEAEGMRAVSVMVRSWVNLEIRGPDGDLLVLTNPGYARTE